MELKPPGDRRAASVMRVISTADSERQRLRMLAHLSDGAAALLPGSQT
jgi:hypothetical protein